MWAFRFTDPFKFVQELAQASNKEGMQGIYWEVGPVLVYSLSFQVLKFPL